MTTPLTWYSPCGYERLDLFVTPAPIPTCPECLSTAWSTLRPAHPANAMPAGWFEEQMRGSFEDGRTQGRAEAASPGGEGPAARELRSLLDEVETICEDNGQNAIRTDDLGALIRNRVTALPATGDGPADPLEARIGRAWLEAVAAAEREQRNLDVAWKMRHNDDGAWGPDRTWIAIGWDDNGGPWHESMDIVEALRGITAKMTPRPPAARDESGS